MNTNDPTPIAAEVLPAKNILTNDVEIIGTLKYKNELFFDGKIDGGIISEGILTIEKNARVKGEVKAKSVTVYGTVNGNISATECCELKASAQLNGNVKAMRIIVDSGATFIGKSEVTTAKVPAVEPAQSWTPHWIGKFISHPLFSKGHNSGVRAAVLSSVSRHV